MAKMSAAGSVGEQCNAFGTMFSGNGFHFIGNIIQRFVPAGFFESCFSINNGPDKRSFQPVFVVILTNTASSTRTEPAVAVLVFVVAYNFLNVPFIVLINPSGTLPETDFTIRRCPAKWRSR